MASFIVVNAFRKLNCDYKDNSFIEFLYRITKLHITGKSGYCTEKFYYPEFSVRKLVKSWLPTIYDMLLLRPFPIYAPGNILSKQIYYFDMAAKGLSRLPTGLYGELACYYEYQLKDIQQLQLLYGIDAYSEERPFFSFSYFDSP